MDSVGWHADDECVAQFFDFRLQNSKVREFGLRPCFDAKHSDALIISLSLGAVMALGLRGFYRCFLGIMGTCQFVCVVLMFLDGFGYYF